MSLKFISLLILFLKLSTGAIPVATPATTHTMTPKRYTKVSKILNRRLKDFAGTKSRRKAAVVIATKLKVSADAIDSWRRGTRGIPEEKIRPLVEALGFKNADGELTAEGQNLVQELEAAREQAEPAQSWYEGVEEGALTLEVREAQYLGAGHFWGRIVSPFLDAACIKHAAAKDKEDRPQNFDELQRAVWAGNVHLALGILSTPRLSLKLYFFNSPITYRVNGVVLDDGVERLGGPQRVRDLLARRAARARVAAAGELGRSRFYPVVMKGAVGEAYVKHNLKIPDVVGTGSLDPAGYCDRLMAKRRKGDNRVRIAVADEITCLSILKRMRGRGRLIFPLVPDEQDKPGLIPPSFPLGIAISRNERLAHVKTGALRAFVDEALTQHIRGNATSIAFSYVALRNKMRQLAEKALPNARPEMLDEWTARTFRLGDRQQTWRLEPPHWQAVLQEAMLLAGRGPGSDELNPEAKFSRYPAQDGAM